MRKNAGGCKKIALGMALGLIALVAVPVLLMLSCAATLAILKFPPQVFGNNEDHFRAHVISPIPASVKILDVQFDDLMIHPDVAYYFRFSVNRSDLNEIIAYNSLEPSQDACFDPSPAPKWWKFSSPNTLKVYQFEKTGLIISLCFDDASKTAYYAYWTY